MLSFLRDQEPENSSVQKPPAADRKQEAPEQEYVAIVPREKQVRKTTYLLAVLFVIGLLCLWFMIKKSTPETATARNGAGGMEESQIETAIARLTGVRSEMFSGLERIVKKFHEFSDVRQVQVGELAKNPFKREIFIGNLSEIADIKTKRLGADTKMVIRQQAEDMQLLSIMQSDRGNCCMIDDKILYEGDLIRGCIVRQISDSFVKLELEGGPEIILKLSE